LTKAASTRWGAWWSSRMSAWLRFVIAVSQASTA